jgi:hypothetical protein
MPFSVSYLTTTSLAMPCTYLCSGTCRLPGSLLTGGDITSTPCSHLVRQIARASGSCSWCWCWCWCCAGVGVGVVGGAAVVAGAAVASSRRGGRTKNACVVTSPREGLVVAPGIFQTAALRLYGLCHSTVATHLLVHASWCPWNSPCMWGEGLIKCTVHGLCSHVGEHWQHQPTHAIPQAHRESRGAIVTMLHQRPYQ